MELLNTIKDMLSDDYRDRMVAEYDQLLIRFFALKNRIEVYDKIPSSHDEVGDDRVNDMRIQADIMEQYIKILRKRIDKEGYYHDDRIK